MILFVMLSQVGEKSKYTFIYIQHRIVDFIMEDDTESEIALGSWRNALDLMQWSLANPQITTSKVVVL